jgi:hypothetical protein
MMIIGDVDRFGIEFELDYSKLSDPHLAEWLFGKIRWWCGGASVGRFEEDATLRDAANEAVRVLVSAGNRRDDGLMRASAATVVATISEALFEDHGQSEQQLNSDEARYRRFVVRPLIEEFDEWNVFLVESASQARLIWSLRGIDELREVWLLPGEFDSVLREFLSELRFRSARTPRWLRPE